MMTVEEAEQIVGEPTDKWGGRCHEIAMKLAPHIEGSKVRRGLFIGPRTSPVAQHSWIELKDGTVLDPTIHAFTDRPPMWHGPADEYDIGGCRTERPRPSFIGDPFGSEFIDVESREYVSDLLGISPDELDLGLSVEAIFYLANLPVKKREQSGVLCEFFAPEVYDAIIACGHIAAIPIDRRKWILDEAY